MMRLLFTADRMDGCFRSESLLSEAITGCNRPAQCWLFSPSFDHTDVVSALESAGACWSSRDCFTVPCRPPFWNDAQLFFLRRQNSRVEKAQGIGESRDSSPLNGTHCNARRLA